MCDTSVLGGQRRNPPGQTNLQARVWTSGLQPIHMHHMALLTRVSSVSRWQLWASAQ